MTTGAKVCDYCGEVAYGGVRVSYPGAKACEAMYFHATCHQLVMELFELSRGRSVS